MAGEVSSDYLLLGFIGTIVVSGVLNALITKIVQRKPETCMMHEDTIKKATEERTSLAEEMQDAKHHIDNLSECFHRLDKKIDVFIETSKVRQDIIIELSGAIKSIANAVCKGAVRHD